MASKIDDIPVAPEVADDLHQNQPDYVHLSDVFKYISHYRRRGHQIGRKVGDMLEVITLAALHLDANAKKRLVLEPKLTGFSGAGHKVEFGIFHLDDKGKPDLEMSRLTGFVECKKVGVEQTIDTGHKKRHGAGYQTFPYGGSIQVSLAPRWAEKCEFAIGFTEGQGGPFIEVKRNGTPCHKEPLRDGSRLIVGLTVSGEPFLIGDTQSLRDVPQSIRACRVLEIAGHTRQGVSCILNNCLPGPQTPEKAKQASFVALDVRKGLFGQFDKRPNEADCVSILVMTEFAHWEPKSVNMVKASIDYNLVVDDALIIQAMEAYEQEFGDGFLDHITKEGFVTDARARNIATALVQASGGRIFRDVEDGVYKAITVSAEGKVRVG